MKAIKPINIVIAGGSGFWAERNHYPAIIQLKEEKFPVHIAAIVDITNPYLVKNRPNLHKALSMDKPSWINPSDMSLVELENELNILIKEKNVDLIIISTNPVHHYFYSVWGLKNNIHVICDKPIVVNPDASFNLSNASNIQKDYEKLEALYKEAKKKNPNYMFGTPLRRRVLIPFMRLADEFEAVYKKTGEGITYMNVISNGGLHRYPIEFLKAGAHGYLEGIGSLAHSSYHYIDIIAWYLQVAKGDIAKIKISLPYILRVKDYIKTKKYKVLKELIEGKKSKLNDNILLSENVLNSELDFTFHMQLLDKQDVPLGLLSFTSNHTTYSPRLAKYNSEIIDHANEKDGGRMSQVYMDIHQGALQNWQLTKNDVVFSGENITLIGRKHPKIGEIFQQEEYKNVYDKGTNPKDLLKTFIQQASGMQVDKKYINLVSTFETQKLTNKFFSLFYEKIAEEFELKHVLSKKHVESTIVLDEYL